MDVFSVRNIKEMVECVYQFRVATGQYRIRSLCGIVSAAKFILFVTVFLLQGCDGKPLPWQKTNLSQVPTNSLHLELVPPKSISAGKDNFIVSKDRKPIAFGSNSRWKSETPTVDDEVVDFSAGLNESVYLTKSGHIFPAPFSSAQTPPVPTNIAKVFTRRSRYLGVTQNKDLVTWGEYPIDISEAPHNIVDVKMSDNHFLALLSDGSVYASREATADINVLAMPGRMTEQFGILRIASGTKHNLALRADGRVFAWGDNTRGQISVPQIAGKVIDVAAMDETSVALLDSGEMVVWGAPLKTNAHFADIAEIDAKYNQLIVRKRDGTIEVVQAEISINYQHLTDVASVSGDLILSNEGNVYPLFLDASEIPLSARKNIKFIKGADVVFEKEHDAGLRWNIGGPGPWGSVHQPTFPPSGYENYTNPYKGRIQNAVHIALSHDGALTIWGDDHGSGMALPPANLGMLKSVQCGVTHCLALKMNGEVAAWGGNYNRQVDVPSELSTAVDIAAGDSFSVAINTDNKVLAWGGNAYKELNVPEFARPIKQVAADLFSAYALDDLGQVYHWPADNAITPFNSESGPMNSLAVDYSGSGYALDKLGNLYWLNVNDYKIIQVKRELPIVNITASGNLGFITDVAGHVDISGGLRIPAELGEIISVQN